jgi:rubrerythrin
MQATSLGSNLTGAALAPEAMQAMLAAADELTPFSSPDVTDMKTQKLRFIAEADAVGSVPMPPTVKGVVKSGVAKVVGGQPTILMDKLGERLAYERTGTRLYDALILKYRASQEVTPEPLPIAVRTAGADSIEESPAQTLDRIRADELAHFNMLCEAISELGGDPTAQTPCADVTALSASGFMQVLNDPRTTLAQCLNAMLAVELADNAGWELLADLAKGAGQRDMSERFLAALAEEQRHASIIKGWLSELLVQGAKPAVA